MSWLSKM